jgi:hypothetical protein
MSSALINVVKIIVTFSNGVNKVIPYFMAVHTEPLNVLDLIWKTSRFSGEGEVSQIQVIENNIVYDVNFPQGLELYDNYRIQISYPNRRFLKTAKKTHIVNISFCMDRLPRDLDRFVAEIVDGIDYAHHPVVNFVHDGYYGEGGSD